MLLRIRAVTVCAFQRVAKRPWLTTQPGRGGHRGHESVPFSLGPRCPLQVTHGPRVILVVSQ
jgi:hypothetical protein